MPCPHTGTPAHAMAALAYVRNTAPGRSRASAASRSRILLRCSALSESACTAVRGFRAGTLSSTLASASLRPVVASPACTALLSDGPWKLRPPSASFVRVRPEGRGGRLAGRRCGAALHAWHRDSHALACAQHACGERRGEWLRARQRSTTSRSSIICAACKQRVRTGSFRRKPRPTAAGPRQTHSSLPRPVGLCSPRLAAARLVSTPFVCRSRKLPCAASAWCSASWSNR